CSWTYPCSSSRRRTSAALPSSLTSAAGSRTTRPAISWRPSFRPTPSGSTSIWALRSSCAEPPSEIRLSFGLSTVVADMKAIRFPEYGGPAVLKLEEVPDPRPGPGQVLVRNRAVGINPVETYLRANTDNRGPKLPYTPGSDAAGLIEAVGAGVTRLQPN